MAIEDGRLEVALAIARTSDLVTVDTQTDPVTVDPDDLFDRTFNDNGVGIDDDQMAVFKAELVKLLNEIESDINRIPENSNQVIEQVAEFVRLALLNNSVK
ncbi:MAG: hypothetical protein AABO57_12255 [Acidobacteriota bacterium]